MGIIFRLLERILTTVLVSLLLAIASFSYFTGKFPPQKKDLLQAVTLVRKIILSTPEINRAGQNILRGQAQGLSPSLEQMTQYQRLALERSEATIQLMKIFEKIEWGQGNHEMAAKLKRISTYLKEAEREMSEITVELQKSMGTEPAEQSH